jgi:hypothetical protein
MKKIVLLTALIAASTASYADDDFQSGHAFISSSGYAVFYEKGADHAVICSYKDCKRVPVKDSDD